MYNDIFNTANGFHALYVKSTGYVNSGFGYAALYLDTAGTHNTALGDSASTTRDSLVNVTVIGARARVSVSNTMVFGDTLVKKWAFGRDSVLNGVFQVGRNNTNGNGAYLTAGGVWTDISASILKEGFVPLNRQDILDKIMTLPVTQWKYK